MGWKCRLHSSGAGEVPVMYSHEHDNGQLGSIKNKELIYQMTEFSCSRRRLLTAVNQPVYVQDLNCYEIIFGPGQTLDRLWGFHK